ncbi:hypothetical protein EGI22_14895 [Lacihabitans sp. LS3-19]|uniref:hypothetical protein n=1 Tax=Lacihabitans sp. LS3-19 TaxID=2487335 RepID=UPI0020CE7945|nr:hypothetical protein [Lacihabitans sp. LS3-19]MCP9769204.1 hypothetical protein [Lacihabitans sp. LS3-19]
MRFLSLFIFLNFSFNLNGQISLFKDINQLEDGSYPSNFREVNGKIFFTVKINGRLELWVTDGTNLNTKKITDKTLKFSSFFYTNLQVDNGYLYFWVNKTYPQNGFELWRTDGVSEEKLLDNSPFNYLYFINHVPYHISTFN